MTKWLLLMAGGGLGTVSRYALSMLADQFFGMKFPFGTLVVNLSGCFFMGVIVTVAEQKELLSQDVRAFLTIGFLGAFTTFSTFAFETVYLAKGGQSIAAVWNIVVSVAGGLMAFLVGVLLARSF